jgi:hypothetical protein
MRPGRIFSRTAHCSPESGDVVFAKANTISVWGEASMRFIIRLIGVVLFAAAFVILVIDGTRSIAGNDLYLSSLAEGLDLLWPGSVESIRSIFGGFWDPVGAWMFNRAAFVVLGILGLALMLLGRAPPQYVRPLPKRY